MIGFILSRRRRFSAALIAAVCASCAATTGAFASTFSVDPIQMYLRHANSSTELNISNQSAQQLRFAVSGYAWSQAQDEPVVLSPTSDLLFFPAIFSLGPGQVRHVRVGATAGVTGRESAYRIIVEELPPLESILHAQPPGVQLSLRTRVSLPLFVEPATESFDAAFTDPQVRGNTVAVSIKNSGNVHLQIPKIVLLADAADGAKVFSATANGWYVLPGATRRFSFFIPRGRCAGIRKLHFRAEGATPFAKTFELAQIHCAP